MKNLLNTTAPFGTSLGTIAASELVAGWVRVAVLVVGLVVTCLVGWYSFRQAQRKALLSQMEVCDECRHGNEPSVCPFPPNERPINCPKNKK